MEDRATQERPNDQRPNDQRPNDRRKIIPPPPHIGSHVTRAQNRTANLITSLIT